MTTIVINGKKVKVSDAFLTMSPEEQNRVVDEIAQTMGATPPSPQSGAADRIAAAKAGTLAVPPDRAEQQAMIDAMTEQGMNDPSSFASFMGNIAPGLTFGGADEIAAGIGSVFEDRTYEEILAGLRNQQDRQMEAHPVASIGGQVVGALSPGGLMAKGVTAAPKLGGAMMRGMGIGAASGGLTGFLGGEGGARNRMNSGLLSAVIGGGLGAAAGGLGSLVGTAFENSAAKRVISKAAKSGKTTDELRAIGGALYDDVDRAGVQIKPEAFDAMRGDALNRLRTNTGFDELPGPGSLTPNSSRVIEIMNQASGKMAAEPTAALPFKSLEQMRRQAGAAAGNVSNKTDMAAGNEIIDTLDDFIAKLGPNDVLAGDVSALQGAIVKAREVWGQMSRSQKIDDAIEAGGDYLSGASSGIRNQFKNLLRNPKRLRGFSDVEKAAMRSVVNGGPLSQIVNLLGGGIAQLGSIAGGGALAGVPGMIGGTALAAGQRKLSEVLTTAAAERARAAIASGMLRQPGLMDAISGAGAIPKALVTAPGLGLIPSITSVTNTR